MFQYLNWRSIETGFWRLKFINYYSLVSFVDLTQKVLNAKYLRFCWLEDPILYIVIVKQMCSKYHSHQMRFFLEYSCALSLEL